jgi:ABC-type multidrug transport system fused ATPase/permease subunit
MQIFKDLNLNIPKGKWVCLYGNSGCGKTSLIKCLLQKQQCDNGNIRYLGKHGDYNYHNIRKISAFINSYEDVFDDTIFYNVTYGLQEVSDLTHAKIHKYMTLFEMGEFITTIHTTNAAKLSMGQRQRIKIIRLILSNRKLWFLDEITSNIDNKLEQIILAELKTIQQIQKISVIHITHNVENILHSDYRMYIDKYKVIIELNTLSE